MNRLREVLAGLRKREEKALGLFLTSGFPDPESTLPILRALDEGGADFLELGMPFSDPLAEGPAIQHASARALAHGTTMSDTLATARAFREASDTPVVLMGYVNPIMRYGTRAFCRDAAASGVDGLILPDLPPEEAELVEHEAADAGLALTFLIAPNTSDDRIGLVDERSTGFVYAVSVTGVTGTEIGTRNAVLAYLHRVRALVRNNPLLVGFGIKTPSDVAQLGTEADGCIVGSSIIRHVEDLWKQSDLDTTERLADIRRFVRTLKDASITDP
jgi:tryptophan synthase alpha chain